MGNNEIENHQRKAGGFNDYFVNVGANIARSNNDVDGNNLSFIDFMDDRLESELSFEPVSMNDIVLIVNPIDRGVSYMIYFI